MRKSDYIVACLLEASPKGTTLRFGPGDDPYGEEFFSFEDALEGQDAAEMMRRGYSFATQKNPGDIGVYSLKPQIGTMDKGISLIAQTFGIDPETKVHFSTVPTTPGKPVPLKDLFRERPMYKKTGEPAPERENPVKAAGVVSQPAAEEEPEMDQPNAKREEYIHRLQGKPVWKNVPLYFGMEVDSTNRQVGVLVSHVIAGGPAAQAGLEAGDRIIKLEFETNDGTWGPYTVKTLPEFKRLRASMQPGYTVGVWYLRGGFERPTGIRPKEDHTEIEPQEIEPTQRPDTGMQLTSVQDDPFIRAWSSMEQNRADMPSLTIDELAQAYKIEPKQVVFILNKLGARTRDYVPHEQQPNEQQPNERDPASLTGNLPANVSALT